MAGLTFWNTWVFLWCMGRKYKCSWLMILASVKIEQAHSTRPLPLIKTETPIWTQTIEELPEDSTRWRESGGLARDTPVKSALGRIGIYPGLGTITAHNSEMSMSTDKKWQKKSPKKSPVSLARDLNRMMEAFWLFGYSGKKCWQFLMKKQ